MANAKPMDERQRRNLPKVMDNSGATSEPPAAPSRLSGPLRQYWDDLWASPAAQLMDPVGDLPAVTRLFEFYSLGKQLANMIDEALTDDSASANRNLKELMTARSSLSAEARHLENALGLSPRARQALGQSLFAGRKATGGLDAAVEAANDES